MVSALALLILAIVAFIALGTVLCSVLIYTGLGRNNRSLVFVGGIPHALMVVVIPCGVLNYWATPLRARARELVNLPPEAQVVRLEEGDGAGNGSVYFRLPPSRRPEEWVDVVWLRNRPAGHFRGDGGSLDLKCTVGGDSYSLGYEPETALYCYTVRLEL